MMGIKPSKKQEKVNAICAAKGGRLWREMSWLHPLLSILLAEMCFKNLWATLSIVIPATYKSKPLLRDTLL